jgi:hypothetical protein
VVLVAMGMELTTEQLQQLIMVVRAMVHMEVTLPLDQVEVKDLVMVQQNHGSEMGTGYAQIQVVEI